MHITKTSILLFIINKRNALVKLIKEMNMAIKVNTTEVITNALELQNIATIDSTTDLTMQAALRAVNHALIIRDSAGNETFRIHGLPA
jgi:hypothetical protein|tara:strand:- start:534 stop:797 length:264 start_codon:yes stop_codon:yes gene_type:complete